MASSGPNYPSVAANSPTSGIAQWVNPDLAKTVSDDAATCFLMDHEWGAYLHLTGFAFAIPAGSTINGVVVAIKASEASGAVDGSIENTALVVSGSRAGTAKTGQALTTTLTTYSLGTTADLWGCTLTPAIVNASDFGVSFRGQNWDPASSPYEGNVSVAYARITIYYTAGTSAAPGFHTVL